MDQTFSQLRTAAEAEPVDVEAQLAFAACARDLGKVREPYEALSRALESAPTDARVQICTADFLLEQGQFKDAYTLFESAADAGFIDGLAGMVAVFEQRGDLRGAMSLLKANQELLGTSLPMVLQTVSVLSQVNQADDAFDLLSDIPEEVREGAAGVAYYSLLGNVEDARGHHSLAAEAYITSNKLRDVQFNNEALAVQVAGARALYGSRDTFASLPRADFDTPSPLLIVGAPRTGSSLLEQMLGCHPSISAAGELDDLRELAGKIDAHSDSEISDASDRYVGRLRTVGPFSRYVTDKMPHNLFNLGLLAQLAPGARVIWCRRDHRDTALSIFTKNLHATHDYATDIAATGEFLKATETMMAHWQTVLPLPIHEVHYEQLVAAPKETLQAVTTFLDVEWNPAMLNFHNSARTVSTASHTQIQEPLHGRSVGRAQQYLEHLPGLADLPSVNSLLQPEPGEEAVAS